MESVSLGSDIPKLTPQQDAFGYAPFATLIARAIETTPSPQGLVMSIHGAWGSGKSTLMNFVKHELTKDEKPILVVSFNPWWFNDRDHLAGQFINEFQKALKFGPSKLKEVGKLMSDYADELGSFVAAGTGFPMASKMFSWFFKMLGKDEKKDLPTLKKQVADALRNQHYRILFLIDDIDRLTPDEIRELFKVIKALADFPNVIYLLSFDKNVVESALNRSLGIDGGAYLEKIIQAPFTLPMINRSLLRQAFIDELNDLLNKFPNEKFNSEYWQNVFIEGIDRYIAKPRDVVRLSNTLRVTYPPLAAELNVVDLIAIETLRIFEPEAYRAVKENSEKFIGYRDQNRDPADALRVFHEGWLEKIEISHRAGLKALLSNIFPLFASTFGESGYSGDWMATWRNQLRVCTPEFFPIYFQFSLPANVISRKELMTFLNVANENGNLEAILLDAESVRSDRDVLRSKEYLVRIRELDNELNAASAARILKALYNVGDKIVDLDESDQSMFSMPRHWTLLGTIDHLLGYINEADRHRVMRENFSSGDAIGLSAFTTERISHYLKDPGEGRNRTLSGFSQLEFEDFKAIIVDRLRTKTGLELIDITDVKILMHIVVRWGFAELVKDKITSVFMSTYSLPKAIDKFKHVSRTQIMGKPAITRVVQLDPTVLAEFVDIEQIKSAVEVLLLREDISSDQRTAGENFLMRLARLASGEASDDND